MGASSSTPTINLPLFSDSDRPTWRGDVNGMNNSVDTAIASDRGAINNIITGFDQTEANNVATTASKTRGALHNMFYQVDSDYVSLDAALAATPNGGVLVVRNTWTVTSAWVINKPCTVWFERGGSITTHTAGVKPVLVQSSGVTLQSPAVYGNGAVYDASASGISAVGTVSSPIDGLRIYSPTISGFGYAGIYGSNLTNFRIEDINISQIGYAGVLLLSAINGRVKGGTVTDVLQPAGYVNSYGVSVTRDSTQTLANAPKSSNVVFEDITVTNVASWEGFDSHAGNFIRFIACYAINCLIGFAHVSGKDTVNTVTKYAPQFCHIKDCVADSRSTNGDHRQGFMITGAVDTAVGLPDELAVGCSCINNTAVNHGTDSAASSNTSAFLFQGTQALKVIDNTAVQPATSGFDLYHDNYGAKVRGNTVIDAWATTGPQSVCFNNRSTYNTVSYADNVILRGTKAATHVNDLGISGVSGGVGVAFTDGGGNRLDAATTPTAGLATTATSKLYAPTVNAVGNVSVDTVTTTGIITLSGLQLRNAAGNIQISTDGATWKTVTAT